MAKIKLIVDGGNMKPGPAVAQQLGPLGINLGKVIEDVNSATSGFKGVKVPVELDVNAKTKEVSIKVFSPPISELIKKELKLEKASAQAGKIYVAIISVEELISVAKTKMPGMLAKDLKAALKLAAGSCKSLGVLIDGKDPVEIIQEINSGKYDSEIKEEKTQPSEEKRKKLDSQFAEIKDKQEEEKKAKDAEKAKEEAEKAEKAEETPESSAPKAEEKPADKPAAKKK